MFVHFLTPSNQYHSATEELKSAGVAGSDFSVGGRDPLIKKRIFLHGKQAKIYTSGQKGDEHKFEMLEINNASKRCKHANQLRIYTNTRFWIELQKPPKYKKLPF